MAGRPPKAVATKWLAGNPGKRPLPKPRVAGGAVPTPRCPAHLSDVARREWRRVAPGLSRAGVLDLQARSVLALYCQAYATWCEAESHLQTEGRVMQFESGYKQVSPWVGIGRAAQESMRQAMADLGMTPASRERVSGAGVEKDDDPFESFVRRKLDEGRHESA